MSNQNPPHQPNTPLKTILSGAVVIVGFILSFLSAGKKQQSKGPGR